MTPASNPPAEDHELAIITEHLGKRYRVYHGQDRGWMKSILLPFWKERFYEPFDALTDINLRVPRGAVLGVLGRNGSGKSTLLRLLAGISAPTSGRVDVRGQVRCLLATGVSFSERLTGRENILYGSVAMGIPADVAKQRMHEIIEFSELGPFIDKPARIYSAGMATKLAFAVAFQETPEILLLDEAMSAGDMFFQHRVDQRVKQIVSSGSTVVLTSHSTGVIKQLCTQAVLIDQGRLVADGPTDEVLERYRAMLTEAEANRPAALATQAQEAREHLRAAAEKRTRARESELELRDVYMCDADGNRSDSFDNDGPLELRIRLSAAQRMPTLRITLDLISEDFGVRLTNTGTEHLSADTGELGIFPIFDLEGEQEIVVRLPKNPLGSGVYSWTLAIRPFDSSVSTENYVHASRLAPFRSVSFPGHSLGHLRRMPIETPVQLSLEPCAEAPTDEGKLHGAERPVSQPG